MCVGCWHFETHGVCTCVYCVRHCLYRHRKSPLGNSSVKLTQCSLFFCMWKCMCMSVCLCMLMCGSVGVCTWLVMVLLVASLIPSKPSKYGVVENVHFVLLPLSKTSCALMCPPTFTWQSTTSEWLNSAVTMHHHFLLVQEGMTWYSVISWAFLYS